MAFCPNCGRKIEDPSVGCPICDAKPTTNQEPKSHVDATNDIGELQKENRRLMDDEIPANNFDKTPKSSKNKPFLVIGAVAAAIVLVVVLILSVFGGKGYKKAINTYFDFEYKGKIENFEKLAPAAYWDYFEDVYDMKAKEMIEENEEYLEALVEELEDEWGKNIKVSYKIIEAEKLDKDDLKEIKDALKSRYDIAKKSVTEAYDIELEFTVKGSEDEDEDEAEFYAVKIDGKWYLLNDYYSFMLPSLF